MRPIKNDLFKNLRGIIFHNSISFGINKGTELFINHVGHENVYFYDKESEKEVRFSKNKLLNLYGDNIISFIFNEEKLLSREAEIFSLIDFALDVKDKQWYESLVNELNNLKEELSV